MSWHNATIWIFVIFLGILAELQSLQDIYWFWNVFFFQATGVTAFAHFDEYLRLERLEAFVEKFKTAIFHRTYYSYEDEDEDSELWEWDEMEDAEEEEAESEVDQGIIVLETWG